MNIYLSYFFGPNDPDFENGKGTALGHFLVQAESVESAETIVQNALKESPGNQYLIPDKHSFNFSHCELVEFDQGILLSP